jgi:hypothetical protein
VPAAPSSVALPPPQPTASHPPPTRMLSTHRLDDRRIPSP